MGISLDFARKCSGVRCILASLYPRCHYVLRTSMLFASTRVIRGQIFFFLCIRPARRRFSEGGCSFVVRPAMT